MSHLMPSDSNQKSNELMNGLKWTMVIVTSPFRQEIKENSVASCRFHEARNWEARVPSRACVQK